MNNPNTNELPIELSDLPTNKRKRKLTKKAPDAPKRFLSPYVFFVKEKMAEMRDFNKDQSNKNMNSTNKDELTHESSDIKSTDMMKVLSMLWKSLPEKEIYKYEELARKDRERYEYEMAHYSGPFQVPNIRAKKPHDAPKRFMSAFLHYSQEKRSEVSNLFPYYTTNQITALLSQQWHQLSPEEKTPYLEKELEGRKDYHERMKEYREKNMAIASLHKLETHSCQDLDDNHTNYSIDNTYSIPMQVYPPHPSLLPSENIEMWDEIEDILIHPQDIVYQSTSYPSQPSIQEQEGTTHSSNSYHSNNIYTHQPEIFYPSIPLIYNPGSPTNSNEYNHYIPSMNGSNNPRNNPSNNPSNNVSHNGSHNGSNKSRVTNTTSISSLTSSSNSSKIRNTKDNNTNNNINHKNNNISNQKNKGSPEYGVIALDLLHQVASNGSYR